MLFWKSKSQEVKISVYCTEGNIKIQIRVKNQDQRDKSKHIRVTIEVAEVQGSLHLIDRKFWVARQVGFK